MQFLGLFVFIFICAPQLAYCVVQFLEKDPTLTEPVLFFSFFSLIISPTESTKTRHYICLHCREMCCGC